MLIVLREKKAAQELLGNRWGQQEVPWRIISNVAYASLPCGCRTMIIQGDYFQLVSLFNTKIENCPGANESRSSMKSFKRTSCDLFTSDGCEKEGGQRWINHTRRGGGIFFRIWLSSRHLGPSCLFYMPIMIQRLMAKVLILFFGGRALPL